MHIQFQSKLQAKKVSSPQRLETVVQSVYYLFSSHKEVDFFLLKSKNGNYTISVIDNNCVQL